MNYVKTVTVTSYLSENDLIGKCEEEVVSQMKQGWSRRHGGAVKIVSHASKTWETDIEFTRGAKQGWDLVQSEVL